MKHIIKNDVCILEIEFKTDVCYITIIKGEKKLTKMLIPAELQELKELINWKV